VSIRYDYDSRIGQDTKVNPMTNPAGAESFYGSRAFLEESGRAATGPDIIVRCWRVADIDNKSVVHFGPDMDVHR